MTRCGALLALSDRLRADAEYRAINDSAVVALFEPVRLGDFGGWDRFCSAYRVAPDSPVHYDGERS